MLKFNVFNTSMALSASETIICLVSQQQKCWLTKTDEPVALLPATPLLKSHSEQISPEITKGSCPVDPDHPRHRCRLLRRQRKTRQRKEAGGIKEVLGGGFPTSVPVCRQEQMFEKLQ